jgi:hypothetical protein
MSSKASKETLETLRKLLRDLGFDFPGLIFIERDCIYKVESAIIHEVDRTPVIFDPGLGGGTGEVPARCFESSALDLGGQAVTDNAGRLTWKLSDFVCNADRAGYQAPASFVTTALSTAPIFLTARILSTGGDLVVDVFSWDTSGAPAPNVRFAWRCWVPTQAIVL